jgi:VIT1/CCC1 family predicted Fe2+/Mn2+ transporter
MYARCAAYGARTGGDSSGNPASTHALHRAVSRCSEEIDRYADFRVVMKQLLSFPNPVNETSARFVAGVVAVLAVVAIAFQQGGLLPVLAYGFVARALTGPKLSPLGLVATRLVTPRLHVAHRYTPGPPKRFAQAIGAAFTVTATVLWFGLGQQLAASVLLAVLAVFASLEAGFGLCVGCKTFFLGMRLGLVPAQICEECRRVA